MKVIILAVTLLLSSYTFANTDNFVCNTKNLVTISLEGVESYRSEPVMVQVNRANRTISVKARNLYGLDFFAVYYPSDSNVIFVQNQSTPDMVLFHEEEKRLLYSTLFHSRAITFAATCEKV